MVYIPMGGSPTINVMVYALFGGLTKLKVYTFTLFFCWVVKCITKEAKHRFDIMSV